MLTPWIKLASQMATMSWEAQQVIALRMLRIAQGGRRGHKEISTMTAEKVKAVIEAQLALARAAPRTSHQGAKTILGVYRKRVRKNKGRLSRRP
jgi:type IV secretory pathway ATPase VirB11/archaellum biosynthesis ATPase